MKSAVRSPRVMRSKPAKLSTMRVACGTIALLAPILYWIHGPAVSADQAVLRGVLVVIAIVIAAATSLFGR